MIPVAEINVALSCVAASFNGNVSSYGFNARCRVDFRVVDEKPVLYFFGNNRRFKRLGVPKGLCVHVKDGFGNQCWKLKPEAVEHFAEELSKAVA